MPLTNLEKEALSKEIVCALRKTDYESIYYTSEKRRAQVNKSNKKYRSQPEKREKERGQDRAAKRIKNNSDLEPSAPSSRDVPKYSAFEIENREIIRRIFPFDELEFNSRPLFLYNPVTKGRMEGDAINFTTKVIFETNEITSHRSRYAQTKDLQKKEIARYHGWGFITITESQRGHVESFIRQEWQKILDSRKRLH